MESSSMSEGFRKPRKKERKGGTDASESRGTRDETGLSPILFAAQTLAPGVLNMSGVGQMGRFTGFFSAIALSATCRSQTELPRLCYNAPSYGDKGIT